MNPPIPARPTPSRAGGRRVGATGWMLVAMAAGVVVGWLFPAGSQYLAVVSNIFLRLIKCIVTPLIFSTLVVGIAGHGDDLKTIGRRALKTIVYFEIITTLALAVGLVLVNILRPGVGVQLPPPGAQAAPMAAPLSTAEMLERAVPRSFFESAANNDGLQVLVFAVIFGAALAQMQGQPRETMVNFFAGVSQVMFKFTGLIMHLAPLGIGAAMAVAVGRSGFGVLASLGKLALTLYLAIAVFALVVLLPAAMVARVRVGKFCRAIRQPALLAFSTTSSEAALPSAMEQMVAFGVPQEIVSFVMPAGYSFNLDGSALYLTIATLFVAQAAGVHMTPGAQLAAMFTLMLTSKGVAGVPRAALVVLSGTLAS